MKVTAFVLAGLLVDISPLTGAAQGTSSPPVAAEKALQALQSLKPGGFVLVVLPEPANALGDVGRLTATSIGKLLAGEAIPVGHVYAAPQQTATETAERLAKSAHSMGVVQVTELGGSNAERAELLRRLAASSPLATNNTVVVAADRYSIETAFGKPLAGFGTAEIAVFEPTDAGFKWIARVKLMDLPAYRTIWRGSAEVPPATARN